MATGPRFLLLEPSKVGTQHITLIEAYLRALGNIDLPARGVELVYRADQSSFAALAGDVRAAISHQPIAVRNPERRQWLRKVAQELRATLAAARALRQGDLLLITCLSSPTLLLVELLQRRFRRGQIMLVLHSELEALFDPRLRSWKSWGLWAFLWSKARRADSRLGLAVIAGFIREALERLDGRRFAHIHTLPFPVLPFAAADTLPDPASSGHVAVFIGYRTRFKGFDRFSRLAAGGLPALHFRAIGGGQVEELPQGTTRSIDPARGFLGEIAAASVAVFPYSDGYAASLSAAALDALAAGVHLLASRRPCFVALGDELGADFLTLFDSDSELEAMLADAAFLDRVRAGAAARRARLQQSMFGPRAIEQAFAALLDEAGHPLPGKEAA